MAGLLEDMAAYLQSLSVSATIFDDTMLESPDEAIALIEYTGAVPLPQIEGVLRSVQVQVRHKMSSQARALANSIFKLLQSESGIVEFTAERTAMVSLRQPPFKLSVDKLNRTLYCFNVGITTQLD